MIVDCHTHWGRAWTQRDGLDPGRWLAVLDRHGVSHAVVLPEAGLQGRVRQDNDDVHAVCRRSGGRMLPFCTVNIWFREEALAELRRCLADLGFAGVKFHPWIQGVSVSHPVMDEVCDLAEQHDVPVLFHDGTPPFSLPSQAALLARRHPRTRIILGHTGLYEHWREAVQCLRTTPNLWGCLCSPPAAAMRYALDQVDRSRIVWGTDFGYGLADCMDYRKAILYELGLDDAALAALLWENPRRLLNLPPSPAASS